MTTGCDKLCDNVYLIQNVTDEWMMSSIELQFWRTYGKSGVKLKLFWVWKDVIQLSIVIISDMSAEASKFNVAMHSNFVVTKVVDKCDNTESSTSVRELYRTPPSTQELNSLSIVTFTYGVQVIQHSQLSHSYRTPYCLVHWNARQTPPIYIWSVSLFTSKFDPSTMGSSNTRRGSSNQSTRMDAQI